MTSYNRKREDNLRNKEVAFKLRKTHDPKKPPSPKKLTIRNYEKEVIDDELEDRNLFPDS